MAVLGTIDMLECLSDGILADNVLEPRLARIVDQVHA